MQNDGFIYQANLNADAAPGFLQIGLFNTFGVFANGISPGTYTIAGAALDLGTCGLCLLIATDAASDGTPTDYSFATGGTVKIDTVTPALTGKLLKPQPPLERAEVSLARTWAQHLQAVRHKRAAKSVRGHQRLLSQHMARPVLQSVQPQSHSSPQAP